MLVLPRLRKLLIKEVSKHPYCKLLVTTMGTCGNTALGGMMFNLISIDSVFLDYRAIAAFPKVI